MKTATYCRKLITLLLTVLMTLLLVACSTPAATDNGTASAAEEGTAKKNNKSNDNADTDDNNGTGNRSAGNSGESSSDAADAVKLDADELFTDRDLTQTPDLTDASEITVSDGKVIDITEEGTYHITGTAANCTIRVDAGVKDKVALVFDGVTVSNEDFPAVYVVSADKCFLTFLGTNSLSVTGEFRADGDTNTDAVIFSKDDLVLNGTGSVTVNSAKGNGVSCKDDLKITGGTYTVTTALDSFEANDSIAVKDGTFTITSSKDAFHSEDEDDYTAGYVYIGGGTFTITATSDGIQGTTFVRIDGGTIKITGREAIEATYVVINDGNLDLYGSDDGINASLKSKAYTTPTIVFNGGYTKVAVGSGDTDAIDSNGDIYVNGGTIDVTSGISSFDYEYKAEFNGGTIIINGEQVDSIPESMFGPGGFGGRGGQFPGVGEHPDGTNRPDGSGFPGGRKNRSGDDESSSEGSGV